MECQALSEIILHSPILQTLRLVNINPPEAEPFSPRTCRSPETVTFPSLQSLCLVRASDIPHFKIRAVDVPMLAHLDLHIFDHTLTSQTLRALGEQLWSVGLKQYIPAVGIDVVWTILRECPNIREFTYILHPFQLKLESLIAPHPTFRLRIILKVIPQPVVSHHVFSLIRS
jgi:hypothetical protein